MFSIHYLLFLSFLLTTPVWSATTVADSPIASPSTPKPPSKSAHPHPSSPSTSTAEAPHASPASPSTSIASSPHTSPASPSTSTASSPHASPASPSTSSRPSSHPTAPSPSSNISSSKPSSHSSSSLDPKQREALQSLEFATAKDPCSHPSPHNATVCDNSSPFRHLISLNFFGCDSELSLSTTALKALSTLKSLSFTDCPISPIRFPSDLTLSLLSFSSVNSLKHLSAVWLSRFVNLTELVVSDVPVSGRGLYVVLGNMKKIKSLTISNANVTGKLPRHLNPYLTHIDLSGNSLKGDIPSSLTSLENLESLNLYSNSLTGEIPSNIGDLSLLKNVSLGSNSFTGSIPESISDLGKLVHLDLSSNQLNGTIPKFLGQMKQLKYLNLEDNQFHGVVPFNASFISKLEEFKVSGNSLLCYNNTVLSKRMKLGIAPCDKHGMPVAPPTAKDTSGSGSEDENSDYSDTPESNKTKHHHSGPNKVVIGVVITLGVIVFLIVFLVCLSRKCC